MFAPSVDPNVTPFKSSEPDPGMNTQDSIPKKSWDQQHAEWISKEKRRRLLTIMLQDGTLEDRLLGEASDTTNGVIAAWSRLYMAAFRRSKSIDQTISACQMLIHRLQRSRETDAFTAKEALDEILLIAPASYIDPELYEEDNPDPWALPLVSPLGIDGVHLVPNPVTEPPLDRSPLPTNLRLIRKYVRPAVPDICPCGHADFQHQTLEAYSYCPLYQCPNCQEFGPAHTLAKCVTANGETAELYASRTTTTPTN